MATLSTVAVHPIKGLEPAHPDRVGVTPVGGLNADRAYAIVDADGEYVNGKRTDAVHRVRADYDLDAGTVTLGVRGDQGDRGEADDRTFHLDRDRAALETWLSEHFGYPVELEAGPGGSRTDGVVYGDGTAAVDDRDPSDVDGRATGPTVIAAATLREVASWFDGIDPGEMRLRLRPNLVVEGVPAFWADRLFAGDGSRLRIDGVELGGVKPIPRCVVPTRNPRTGEKYERFRETFVREREATLPDWTDPGDLDGNFFSLMAAARVPPTERDGALAVGDPVELLDG